MEKFLKIYFDAFFGLLRFIIKITIKCTSRVAV